MRQVKTDLRGKNAFDVLGQAKNTLKMMEGNPHFPDPLPSLADLRAACEELQDSLVETTHGGNRLQYLRKQQRLERVCTLLKGLAAYVGVMARGSSSAVVSAGFELRRPSTRITELKAPNDLRATTGTHWGTIDLRWDPVRGARFYRVFITDEPSKDQWQVLALTSSSRYKAVDLPHLQYRWFKVEAVGAHATSPVSDIATALSIGVHAA
jgi:hypothetical protein